ncbi:AAA family ATPase [Clostridium ljungdahlii]|uniref:Nuclease SbcCD subunit C n=1 Tax=Clostridium ljungdahlii TaxID=1538 RepID=A0A170NKH1_9CLOT|nr:AAA family ATPase [Clostridium ljungdahlii]OAA91230.1 Chromosome partition protein Smc [Clostridium ljungdahlii]
MSNRIVLKELYLKNFKGIKELDIDFENTTNIYGDNGTGKTTVFDAFAWLLFDKDSQNISKFDVQPLDKSNNIIHRIDTEVTGSLEIDGVKTVLRKVLKEKWVKPKGKPESELKGVTTTYYIDDVPKKQGEYKEKISSIIPEDIFKLVTNPLYFSTNMKWQDRKKILMDIIGELTDENVIDSKKDLKPLKDLLGNKSIEELKKSINSSRKKLIKDRESIQPRIDELNMAVKDDINFQQLEVKKQEIVSKINNIEEQLIDKSKINDEVFKKKDKLYGLKSKLKDIERDELRKVRSGKDKIAEELYSITGEIADIKFHVKSIESEKNNNLNLIKTLETDVKNLRKEWYEENNKSFELPEDVRICPLCKRPFDEEDVEEHKQELEENFKQNKSKILKEITRKGSSKADEIEKYEKKISENELELEGLLKKLDDFNNKKDELQSKFDNFKAAVDLNSNKEYQNTLNQIEILENELSKPIEGNSKIEELKKRKALLGIELENVNYDLGYKEINVNTKSRIKELQDKEKTLAQQIADLEKQDFMCDEFIKTKVKLMESSINSKFKYVKFRFFKAQVNGGIEEDCEPLIDGVPFSTNLNSGARINAGIDIINTLSSHYEIKAPIFIDNRESTTRLIDTESQIINLVVSSMDKKLRVENSSEVEQTELAG